MNLRGAVRETEVPKHSRPIYSRTTFLCSGSGDTACPYMLEMFYYLQKSNPHAEHTTIIHAHNEHNHDISSANAGTHLSPEQWVALTSFLAGRATATTNELADHLQERGCSFTKDRKLLTVWRKNYVARAKNDRSKTPARFPEEQVEQAKAAQKLIDLVEYQKIAEWAKWICIRDLIASPLCKSFRSPCRMLI